MTESKESRIARIALNIVAMPTIWNKAPYKVSVYNNDAEGSHKKRRVSLLVSKGKETGNIAIRDGEVLNGNLSAASVRWCRDTILSAENKKRINKMLSDREFYRLDRPAEVAAHPIASANASDITDFTPEPRWEDTFIRRIRYLGGYRYRMSFADGSIKTVDIEAAIHRNPKVFKRLIEHPELAAKVKKEPAGVGIYWDDLMGYPCDWLYEIGK